MVRATCPLCGGHIDRRVREDEWPECVKCGWNTTLEYATCETCGTEQMIENMVDVRGVTDTQPVWKCMRCIDYEVCKQCYGL
jgi:hypothetical protein